MPQTACLLNPRQLHTTSTARNDITTLYLKILYSQISNDFNCSIDLHTTLPTLLNVRKQTMIPTLSDTGIDYSQVQSPICLNFIWLYFINKLPYIWQICVVAKEQNARVLRCKRIFFEPVSRPHGRHLAAIPFASLVKSLNNVFAIQDIQL